eukprot:10123490-Alexandrium_andersonii.AAC.1
MRPGVCEAIGPRQKIQEGHVMAGRGRGEGNASVMSQRDRLPLRPYSGGRAALAAPRAGVSP